MGTKTVNVVMTEASISFWFMDDVEKVNECKRDLNPVFSHINETSIVLQYLSPTI